MPNAPNAIILCLNHAHYLEVLLAIDKYILAVPYCKDLLPYHLDGEYLLWSSCGPMLCESRLSLAFDFSDQVLDAIIGSKDDSEAVFRALHLH